MLEEEQQGGGAQQGGVLAVELRFAELGWAVGGGLRGWVAGYGGGGGECLRGRGSGRDGLEGGVGAGLGGEA